MGRIAAALDGMADSLAEHRGVLYGASLLMAAAHALVGALHEVGRASGNPRAWLVWAVAHGVVALLIVSSMAVRGMRPWVFILSSGAWMLWAREVGTFAQAQRPPDPLEAVVLAICAGLASLLIAAAWVEPASEGVADVARRDVSSPGESGGRYVDRDRRVGGPVAPVSPDDSAA